MAYDLRPATSFMDKIVLVGLEFHGYHGLHPQERAFGARYVVDVEMELRLSGEDELSATVDYSQVYELVRGQVTQTRYKLIEALAARIADELMARHARLEQLTVRVHKPHAPLPGVVRDIYTEVRRQRK